MLIVIFATCKHLKSIFINEGGGVGVEVFHFTTICKKNGRLFFQYRKEALAICGLGIRGLDYLQTQKTQIASENCHL